MKKQPPATSANKDDPVADALEALTGYAWRLRSFGQVYECRVNHTHAKVIRDDLADAGVVATLEVSAQRSGRYIVTAPAAAGQMLMNAAARLPRD